MSNKAPRRGRPRKDTGARAGHDDQQKKEEIVFLDPRKLIAPELDARRGRDDSRQYELEKSIRRDGVLFPILVRVDRKGYQVVDGQSRREAAIAVGLAKVPCRVVSAQALDAERLKLVANEVRTDLNRLEMAEYLHKVKAKFKLTNRSLAEMTGLSEQAVGQYLGLLEWPPALRKALWDGVVSFSAGRELAKITDPDALDMYLHYARESGCTPRLATQWRAEWEAAQSAMVQAPPPNDPNAAPAPVQEAQTQCFLCARMEAFTKMQPVWLHPECRHQFSRVLRELQTGDEGKPPPDPDNFL